MKKRTLFCNRDQLRSGDLVRVVMKDETMGAYYTIGDTNGNGINFDIPGAKTYPKQTLVPWRTLLTYMGSDPDDYDLNYFQVVGGRQAGQILSLSGRKMVFLLVPVQVTDTG